MSDIQKQIEILQKQNECMETSFKNKNIIFSKLSYEDNNPEKEIIMLKNYNQYLKEISKQNRPPSQVKEVKPIIVEKATTKKNIECEDDCDDEIKEVKPVYSTIANMEEIKRAFFSKEYNNFLQLIRSHSFKYYNVNYKYASDNTGRPNYVAKNLLRGFVQSLDDYRKYLMVCFRCILINDETNEYVYPSYWIVNSNDDLKTILGNQYDDFDFVLVNEEEQINNLLKKIERNENEEDSSLIGEIYLH